jgi:hypothetical protein
MGGVQKKYFNQILSNQWSLEKIYCSKCTLTRWGGWKKDLGCVHSMLSQSRLKFFFWGRP